MGIPAVASIAGDGGIGRGLKQTAQTDRPAEEAEREFDFAKRLLTRLLIS
jgi:hypothetical protein